jgi:hypothetical protein
MIVFSSQVNARSLMITIFFFKSNAITTPWVVTIPLSEAKVKAEMTRMKKMLREIPPRRMILFTIYTSP